MWRSAHDFCRPSQWHRCLVRISTEQYMWFDVSLKTCVDRVLQIWSDMDKGLATAQELRWGNVVWYGWWDK